MYGDSNTLLIKVVLACFSESVCKESTLLVSQGRGILILLVSVVFQVMIMGLSSFLPNIPDFAASDQSERAQAAAAHTQHIDNQSVVHVHTVTARAREREREG
jgi:hypothetical protein